MSNIDPSVWSAISANRPTGEELNCRLALPDESERLFCAVDGNGNRHLLIALAGDEDGLEDKHSRGIGVETRDLTQEARVVRYIDISCGDARAHGFFDLMAVGLAQQLRSNDTPCAVVRRELARWRRFWSDLPAAILTREEQLGLFAELWFLLTWLYPRIGPAAAIARWRGPFGGRHDFEWPARGIEVKGTTSQRGRVHHINGIDQLKAPEEGKLFLFSLKLRESGSARNSLPLLIEACRQPLSNEPEALSAFENALARFGYSDANAPLYAELTIEPSGEMLFEVEGVFPRLTSAIVGPTSLVGIEHIEYDLNLTGFEHLALVSDEAILAAVS